MIDPLPNPNEIFTEMSRGNIEYDVLYKIPASEDYPHGNYVGFIEGPEGWKYAVSFENGGISNGRFALSPIENAPFPSATKWCITENTAIDYGIEAEETPDYRQ